MAKKTAPITLVGIPSSQIEIQGDSTLIGFSARATQVSVSAELHPNSAAEAQPEGLWKAALAGRIKNFTLSVPITALNSSDALLDKHMHKALNGSQYPEITAQILSYDLKLPSQQAGKGTELALVLALESTEVVVGALIELTIAGVTKTVPIEAQVRMKGSALRISGEKEIFMKDFGITPPVHMFGTIRVANGVTIGFRLGLKPKP